MAEQKIFNITKYRVNSKNTGAIVTLTHYDAEKKTFSNVKASVRFASQFAGKNADELPASMCQVKDGVLWIKVTRLDEFKPRENDKPANDEENPF